MPFFTEENCSLHPVCTHCPVGLSSVATPFPLHSPQLDALGLRQGTAFACLFDFLYRPSEEVLSVMRPQLPPLLDPGAIKVGEGRGGGGAGRSRAEAGWEGGPGMIIGMGGEGERGSIAGPEWCHGHPIASLFLCS